MMHRATRRQFIAGLGAAGVSLPLVLPRLARGDTQARKLRVGFVATGGQAGSHTNAAHRLGLKCVCFAEVNRSNWKGVLEKEGWDKATGYTDWRKMFENHAKELDVVFVATPDHSHFAPTMTAISHGIHCYTEKPLTWSVREAQLLAEAYAKNPKVVTQMGNQGHAGQGWRIAYEFIKGGAIGDVLEFHTWTNRPIWPQGGDRPTWTDPVPAIVGLGMRGSARRPCGLMPSVTTVTTSECISRSCGADSSTSVPAPWATWPATRPTASTRSWSPATPPRPSRSS